MNYLDNPVQDWTKPELRNLRDLLVQVYWDPNRAREVAMQAGLVPGTFPIRDNIRLTWTALIREMGNQGNLRALVVEASQDPIAQNSRARFKELLGDNPPVRAPQPAFPEDSWQGSDMDPFLAGEIHFERLLAKRSRLINMDLADLLVEKAPSVAKLEIDFAGQPAFGTGFLIQQDLILTNHHNLFSPELGDPSAVVAHFDVQSGIPSDKRLIVPARLDTRQGDLAHDWAVIRLEKDVERQPLPLGSRIPPGLNQTVVIIQHPNGSDKQFALEPMAIQFMDDNRVQYLADTMDGSSGSPVFNSLMEVIALHHAEAQATVEVDGRQQLLWRNEGIRIERVMKGLQSLNIDFQRN